MTKTTTALAAAVALAACGPKEDPAQKFRDAIPRTQAVEIGTPQAVAGTPGALTVQAAAAVQHSEYATTSYFLALSVNSGVAWTLGFVHLVTSFPPTSVSDDVATWGPWVDSDGLNRWKLVVTRQGESYAWKLSGQPGSNTAAAWVDLVSGTAHPVDEAHGWGTFAVDFDAQDALDHGQLWTKKDYGKLTVDYDNRTAVSIAALFKGAKNSDPQKPHMLDAAYAFDAAATGGVLQVAFHDLDTTEVVSLRTRWGATGAGRGDAHYNGPDGAGGRLDYYASECWAGKAQDFAEVYDSKLLGTPQDEGLCLPFVPAQYADVALP